MSKPKLCVFLPELIRFFMAKNYLPPQTRKWSAIADFLKNLGLRENKNKQGEQMSKIDQKLSSLGIVLPTPAVPVANNVGLEISAEDAKKAARLCASNILAQ